MNLVARINGKVYEIEQGTSFAEEFNETLDSGVIMTTELQEKIADMLPYDDVLIYSVDGKNDDDEYYYAINNQNYTFKGYPFSSTNPKPKFYRHLLVDQFTEDVVNIDDCIFKYKIELMSETKKLETIQCSTISITQPINKKKTTIYEHIKRYVDMFSPVYKEAGENNTWHFKKKYSIDDASIKAIFDGFYTKDITETNGSLKDLLSKLFTMRDCIPYVKDDVIYAMEITKRGEKFDDNPSEINRISGSRTSSNYADNLRRVYSDALSSEGVTRSVEYVGFRNSDNALVTLNNMRLELGMSIYKINKIYACYYKKAKLVSVFKYTYSQFNDIVTPAGYQTYTKGDFVEYKDGIYECLKTTKSTDVFYPDKNTDYWKYIGSTNQEEDYYYLCQQNITPLVKLNTERNVLSQDWLDLTINNIPQSVEDMAKFKFCTVGYDIGSKYISGWGERYTYPNKFYDTEYTVAENIISKVDYFSPYGDSSSFGEPIETAQYIQFIVPVTDNRSYDAITTENRESGKAIQSQIFLEQLVTPYSNTSLNLKGVFFIVDYQGFYNGTITHSKDNERDDITINDNASSPLTLLEADGVFQKSKANRFGNKTVQINARYDSFFDENGNEKIQPLGSVYENDKYEDDIIIYHREYAIYDNFILATYYGTKSYVLKNYYTSVSARYRTWNIMSYNESVKRVENKKRIFLLSKDTVYYESPNNDNDIFKNFGEDKLEKIFSFFKCFTRPNEVVGILNIEKPDQLNYGYIETYDTNGNVTKRIGSDINVFSSGNSLCINLKMNDNFSQGVQINPNKYEAAIGALKFTGEALVGDKNILVATKSASNEVIQKEQFTSWNRSNFNEAELYSGSQQDWIKVVDNTGFAKRLGFFVGHKDMSEYSTTVEHISKDTIINNYKNNLFLLPELKKTSGAISSLSNVIGNSFDLYKENKDCVDMTYQLEVQSKDKNVFVSDWTLKLSDLISNKVKFGEKITIEGGEIYNPITIGDIHTFSLGSDLFYATDFRDKFPVLTVSLYHDAFIGADYVAVDRVTVYFSERGSKPNPYSRVNEIILYSFTLKYIRKISGSDGKSYIDLVGTLTYYGADSSRANFFLYSKDYLLRLQKIEREENAPFNFANFYSEDYFSDKDLYCNIDVSMPLGTANVPYIDKKNAKFLGFGTFLTELKEDFDNHTCTVKYSFNMASTYSFRKEVDVDWHPSPMQDIVYFQLVSLSDDDLWAQNNICAYGDLANFSTTSSPDLDAVATFDFLTTHLIWLRSQTGAKGDWFVDKDNIYYSIANYITTYRAYKKIENSQDISRIYPQNLFVIKSNDYIDKRTFQDEVLFSKQYKSIENNISVETDSKGKTWLAIPNDNIIGSLQVWYVDDEIRYKAKYTKSGNVNQWDGLSYDETIPVYSHFVFGVNVFESESALREFSFVEQLRFYEEQEEETIEMAFTSGSEQFNLLKLRTEISGAYKQFDIYYDDKLICTTNMTLNEFGVGETIWHVGDEYKTIQARGSSSIDKTKRLYTADGDYPFWIKSNIAIRKTPLDSLAQWVYNFFGGEFAFDFDAYVMVNNVSTFKSFTKLKIDSQAFIEEDTVDFICYKFYFITEDNESFEGGKIRAFYGSTDFNSIVFNSEDNRNYGICIKDSTVPFYGIEYSFSTVFTDISPALPIKIYISDVSGKDPRVFDEYHQPIGKVKNFAEDETVMNQQLYTPNKKQ